MTALSDTMEDGGRVPDAHGQAALLLVESLIHALIGRSLLSVADAIDVIEIAAEVKVAMAEDQEEPATVLAASLALLQAMAGSLARDLGD